MILLPAVLVSAYDFVLFGLFTGQVFVPQGGGMDISARMQRACNPLGLVSTKVNVELAGSAKSLISLMATA